MTSNDYIAKMADMKMDDPVPTWYPHALLVEMAKTIGDLRGRVAKLEEVINGDEQEGKK